MYLTQCDVDTLRFQVTGADDGRLTFIEQVHTLKQKPQSGAHMETEAGFHALIISPVHTGLS